MKKIKKLINILSTLLIFIIVMEVFLKYAHISDTAFNEFYEDIGQGIRKNHEFVLFNEGFSIKKTNSQRFYGKELTKKKKNNHLRIAVLGDSYVEGNQVFERDHFLVKTEQFLNRRHPISVELLNFGLSGVDIGDMYAYEKNMLKDFNPDYIIYFLSNDDLKIKNRDPLRPSLHFNDSEIKILKDYKKSSTFLTTITLTQNSHIFMMLNNARLKQKSESIYKSLFGKFYFSEIKNESVVQNTSLSANTITILEHLDPNKTIIANRDNVALNIEFVNNLNRLKIKYWDFSEYDYTTINDWPLKKRKGHWNKMGHTKVAFFLYKNITQTLLRELN